MTSTPSPSGTQVPPATGRHSAPAPEAPAPEAPAASATAPPAAPQAAPGTTPAPAPATGTLEKRALGQYDDRARIASYRRTAPRPPAAQAGAWITLLVGLAVLFSQWGLYPQSARAQVDANWALGFMMISTGGALRILMGNPGRHLVSVGAILVSGVGFLLLAFFGGGEPASLVAFEGVCGALLLLGGLMAAASPSLAVDPPPADPWG